MKNDAKTLQNYALKGDSHGKAVSNVYFVDRICYCSNKLMKQMYFYRPLNWIHLNYLLRTSADRRWTACSNNLCWRQGENFFQKRIQIKIRSIYLRLNIWISGLVVKRIRYYLRITSLQRLTIGLICTLFTIIEWRIDCWKYSMSYHI